MIHSFLLYSQEVYIQLEGTFRFRNAIFSEFCKKKFPTFFEFNPPQLNPTLKIFHSTCQALYSTQHPERKGNLYTSLKRQKVLTEQPPQFLPLSQNLSSGSKHTMVKPSVCLSYASYTYIFDSAW